MLRDRLPALAQSYEGLLKRIAHTGSVMMPTTDGNWYHSSDPKDVADARKRIKSVLEDKCGGMIFS